LATPQSKSLFTLEIEKHQEAKIFINQCNINSLKKIINNICFFSGQFCYILMAKPHQI